MAAVYGRQILLETADHGLHRALVRDRKLRPVCGDQATLRWHNDQAIIASVAPRKSTVWRQDSRLDKRAVAANVDTMLVVAAPRPHTSAGQLDRYLAIASLCKIKAIIIANKSDLEAYADWLPIFEEFEKIGHNIVFTSTKTGSGLASVKAGLAGCHVILAGLSGVGKSSLINSLVPDLELRTATLSAASGGGRHTTTASRLYRLPSGGWVIDAPGVRDIRLWSMSAAQLAMGFVEFKPFISNCKFNDCQHQNEPGCALRSAVDSGHVSQRRYHSFCDLAARLA